jgi:transposase-like protein
MFVVDQDCLAPGLMEVLNPRRMRVMAAPRKYPDELRERAIRLTVDARKDPANRLGACGRIGEQLGINPDTLRGRSPGRGGRRRPTRHHQQ